MIMWNSERWQQGLNLESSLGKNESLLIALELRIKWNKNKKNKVCELIIYFHLFTHM